jgi:phosphohistidine phosphatase
MKHLLIIRHAKSSWDFINMEDFDRPLNDRGNTDAPLMAKRLLKKDIKIDAFISSPAVRALTTATYFVKAYDLKPKHIIQIGELYEAPAKIFAQVVAGIDPTVKTAAIFAHNPGITDYANTLTKVNIDNIPTCGIFAIKAPIKDWIDFEDAEKEFWFFDYPKAN